MTEMPLDWTDFRRVSMIADDFLGHLATHKDGMTLRESKRYIKGLLSRHGFDPDLHLLFDDMVLGVLEATRMITYATDPGVPTILHARRKESAA